MCLMRSSPRGGPLWPWPWPWPANAGVAHSASRAAQRTDTCRNGRFMNSSQAPGDRVSAGRMSRELDARIDVPLAVRQADERQVRLVRLHRRDDADRAVGEGQLRAD